jgi:hypothetical protein
MSVELKELEGRKDSGKEIETSSQNFWLASFDLQYYIKKLEMIYPL